MPALAAKEELPEGAKVVSLEANPAQVELNGKYAYAQMLVTASLAIGDRLDVTRMATANVANDLATISPTGVVRPKADGDGQITFELAGQSLVVPLKVAGQASRRTTSASSAT